jgi:transposase-like protein
MQRLWGGVTSVLDSLHKVDQVDLVQVERTYQERNGFRSPARIFGVSYVTVKRWLKESQANQELDRVR